MEIHFADPEFFLNFLSEIAERASEVFSNKINFSSDVISFVIEFPISLSGFSFPPLSVSDDL